MGASPGPADLSASHRRWDWLGWWERRRSLRRKRRRKDRGPFVPRRGSCVSVMGPCSSGFWASCKGPLGLPGGDKTGWGAEPEVWGRSLAERRWVLESLSNQWPPVPTVPLAPEGALE